MKAKSLALGRRTRALSAPTPMISNALDSPFNTPVGIPGSPMESNSNIRPSVSIPGQINIHGEFKADLEVAVKEEVAKEMEIMTIQLATEMMARSGRLPSADTPQFGSLTSRVELLELRIEQLETRVSITMQNISTLANDLWHLSRRVWNCAWGMEDPGL